MKTKNFLNESLNMKNAITPDNGSRMARHWLGNGSTKFHKNLGRVVALLCLLLTIGVGDVWATDAVFTFNTDAGISALGISKPSKGNGTNLGTNFSQTVGQITMTAPTNGSTATRVWNSNGTLDLRIYNGGTFGFAAASGYVISQIVLAGTTVGGFTANSGTFSSGTWTAANSTTTSVTLTATGTEKINTITVTFASSASCATNPTVSASSNGTICVTQATVNCNNGSSIAVTKGSCDISDYGFVYGTTSNPTGNAISKGTNSSTNVANFSHTITDLTPGQTYYVRAYATVSGSTFYGTQTSFTTKTLTASSSNTTYGTVSRSGRVITGSLKSGGVYSSPAYTVTGASDGSTTTVSRVGNTFTVSSNSTSNITVRINFEAKGCEDKGASSITSTSGGNSYTYGPVSDYHNYSTRQILYTKSDLGLSSSAKKGTIKSIYFYYKHTTAMSKKTSVKIYMANTYLASLSTSSYVPYADFTQVYSGSLNCASTNAWNEFMLDTPFEYNGAGNLVVMIDDNSGQYDGSSFTFYYHSATGAQLYTNSDYTNEDPSTTNWSTYTAGDYRPSTKFCIQEADMEEYTVNWYVNGTIAHSQTGYEGTTLTSIPTPIKSDCDGSKDFVGWYTSTYSHATVAPSYVSPTKMPGSDADYYAVFATASAGGSSNVVLSYTSLGLTTSYESGSTKTVSGIDFYCNDVMTGTSGSDGYQKIQFKKTSTGPGYIYNSEAMPGNITSIVLSSTTRNMTVNFGTSSNPDGSTETTTCTSSSLTATPSGNYKYFKILDAVDNAAYTGTITINYSSVTYSDFTTNCCDPLGAVASVTLTKTAYTITATWPTTSSGNETGYSVQLYDNSGGSKGDAIGDPVVISGTGSANRTHTFGAKTPAGSRLTANHKYYVGVTPTYSGAGDYCPTGTETVANTTTNQTYTVTYNANGGTVTTLPSSGTYEAGDEVTVANKPGTTTKSGCTFTGWNTANDGSGEHYDADGSTTFDMPSSNVTLYAEWTAKKNYFIDRMHGNWDGEHTEPTTGYNCYLREGAGYTVPNLSDNDTGSNSCVTGHAHFVGWVASGNIGAQGQLMSGYTIIKGGTSGTASVDGTIYYAVWAEE